MVIVSLVMVMVMVMVIMMQHLLELCKSYSKWLKEEDTLTKEQAAIALVCEGQPHIHHHHHPHRTTVSRLVKWTLNVT